MTPATPTPPRDPVTGALYRQLVERASDVALFLLDGQGRIATWNAGAERLFGYPEADAVGRSLAVLFPTTARGEGLARVVLARADRDGAVHDDVRLVRRDGTPFWAAGAVSALDAPDGEPAYAVVARDATDRREARSARRADEVRYRTLLDSIDEGFCVFEMLLDAEGRAVDYRFLETNPAFERHTGLVGAVGKTAREMVPDLEDHWVEVYGRVATTGEPGRFEQGSVAMGRVFEVEAFRVVGAPPRVALLFTDITERRRSEEALREMNATLEERVETRAAQVRRLAARLAVAEQQERERIAHVLHDDLQQHLYGLTVLLSVLRAAPPEDADRLHARAEALLDDAVALTRSLSSELSPAVLDSERLADALAWLADRKHQLYGLHVDVRVDEPCVVPDAALRSLLYHVLRELLFNVVKHADTDRARIEAEVCDGEVVLRVEDAGRGFDPDASAPGFGLSSVRSRLALVGGRLDVTSTPGAGTRVTLAVPLRLP